jgi:hypothetical protein
MMCRFETNRLGCFTLSCGSSFDCWCQDKNHLDGQKQTFIKDGDVIMDEQSGSTWNIVGQAIEGPLAGEQLIPIVHGDHFWFSWAAFRPDTIIFGS